MPSKDDSRLARAEALVRTFAPAYRTTLKSSSPTQRLLGKLFSKIGNPAYLALFWTTIHGVTYRPTACDAGATPDEWRVILHEGKHAVDTQRCTKAGFDLAYLFPQWVGILGVVWLLGALVALIFGAPAVLLLGGLASLLLAPLPAPGRMLFEYRAYQVSAALDLWSRADAVKDLGAYVDGFLVGMFTGPSYYYMWPFRKMVKARFTRWLGEAAAMDLGQAPINDAYLRACRELALEFRKEDAK